MNDRMGEATVNPLGMKEGRSHLQRQGNMERDKRSSEKLRVDKSLDAAGITVNN